MLLALALMAQQPLLEASDHDAALTCAAAMRATNPTPNVANTAIALYFLTMSARDGDPMAMQARFKDASKTAADRADSMKPKADALMAECRTRYPLAWKSSPATLPTQQFDRIMICTVSTAAYTGMVRSSILVDGAPEAERIAPILARVSEHMTPELGRANGLNGPDDMPRALSTAMIATLKLGNLRSLVSACEIAFPA